MKRLLTAALAALLTLSASVRAEGPDDTYIEIYRVIQEGDQYANSGRTEFARQRYGAALADLKKLQKSYPNWNAQLVEFRIRTIEAKLAAVTPTPVPAAPANEQPAPQQPAPQQPGAQQPGAQQPPPPQTPGPQTPAVPGPITPVPQPEADDRDAQIRALQEQVGRLQSDRAVLENKLREALAAQPAAIDPRELARAEERIRALEKEKEVLAVSVQVAEAKAAQRTDADMSELRRTLDETKQQLSEQNTIIVALRQEKDVLQQRLQSAPRPDDATLASLRTENEALRRQLAERASAAPRPDNAALDQELSSTKAALQSSRETLASLQVRVRTLQDERDRLDKTRKDLETRLSSTSAAPAPAQDSSQVKRLQKERDDLQKRLTDANRQLADAKNRGKSQPARAVPAEDVSGLRARLEVLEARKVPYTPEELALFKKPDEPRVLTAAPVETPGVSKEPPASAAPLLAEAQRAFAARRFDEAEKKYLEVLQIDDKNVGTLQRLGAAQLEQNRAKDAEATLQRALEQNPKDARTLLLLGIAKFDQDKFDDAFDNLSRSAALDPQNAETQNYLGITLSQKGQRAAAETALRKAIQLSPNYASAHYNLAVVYATQQPPFIELARWHYQKALAYGHPQNPDLEKMLDRKEAAAQK